MNICGTCGFPIQPPGTAYSSTIPMCPWSGHHPAYQPIAPPPSLNILTEEDVRRIVRDELSRGGQP